MALAPTLIRELEAIVGKRCCLTATEDLRCYSYDLFARGLPEVVVLPESTKEVSRVLALARRAGVPVTPRGAATSLTGGPVPAQGGIALSLTRMHRILEISPLDRLVRAQAGVVTADLQQAVLRENLFYPPNPTSAAICTIGGNVATNAGGASGVKYGVTRDYILGLTMVLASGEVLETGSRCLKNVTGYDFTHFLCGSEGRLGVITDVTLRLTTPPASVQTLFAEYADVETAAEAVAAIIQSGVTPAVLELMDDRFLTASQRVYGLELPENTGAALLIELDGPAEAVAADSPRVNRLCEQHGALRVRRARNDGEREILWQARRGGAAALVRESKFLQTLDFAVPVSAIAPAVRRIQKTALANGLEVVIIGHAGDGNLHPMFIYDPDDPGQRQAFERVDATLCQEILSLRGTLSGEHGIGIEKATFLSRELSPAELTLSRRLKRVFDPEGILNPGKCEGYAAE